MKVVFDAISMQITIDEVYCWSDSQIALWWIKQQSWTKGWRQIDETKQNRFFYGMFYS